ncbi:MAG: MarR family transcriptional regulator [Spirochaetales bacterium]|nr:MarR family transcriptional regulator [Spirochaetales bacterium]
MENIRNVSMKLMDSIIKFNRIHFGGHGHAGLKQSEIYTLFVLRHMLKHRNLKGVKVTELSQALRVSPPTVSQTIRTLGREGYIHRERGRSDRRSVLLSVSQEGLDLCDRLHNRLFERCTQLTEHLGQKDGEKLAELLLKSYEFLSGKHENKENCSP